MIKTLGDIVEAFIKKEKELIKKYEIVNHPGMIGQMYEGLTKEILNKIVLPDLDLKIVSGKIITPEGKYSGQIDCMLVTGEGESLPHSDNYIYKLDQVIAAIEVKKTLFTEKIEDAFSHLSSIQDNRAFYYTELPPDQLRLFEVAFHMLFINVDIKPRLKDQTLTEQHVLISLLRDCINPLKIIWSYEGVKNERSLRKAMIKLIDRNIGIAGYEPYQFPELIVCKNSAVVKLNGMPFGFPIENNKWPFLMSSSDNPVRLLIALIWIRLHYKFNLSGDIFGPDYLFEEGHPLFSIEFINNDRGDGWFFNVWDIDKQEEMPEDHIVLYLNNLQFYVLFRLTEDSYIDCEKDDEFKKLMVENNIFSPAFTQELYNMDLIEVNGTRISLKGEVLIGLSGETYYAVPEAGLEAYYAVVSKMKSPHFVTNPKTFKKLKLLKKPTRR